MQHNSNLDILRSFAVLMVFCTHLLEVLAGITAGAPVSSAFGIDTYALGRCGVIIFFVHTSLVLMQSLERSNSSLAPLPFALHFYLRRAFRIYPLAIAVILFCVCFSVPPNALGVSYRWTGPAWLTANLLLVQPFLNWNNVTAPMWSLPLALQMYLLLPPIFFLVRRRSSRATALAMFVLSMTVTVLFGVLPFGACFICGVIAWTRLGPRRPFLPSPLWILTVAVCGAAYVLGPGSNGSVVKNCAICLALAILLPLFRSPDGGWLAVAANHIATYSYGVYLWHTPALWFTFRLCGAPAWLAGPGAVVITVVLSVASYRLIEEPMIRVGRRCADLFVCPRPARVLALRATAE